MRDSHESPTWQALAFFAAEFENHPIREKVGRGQKNLFEDAVQEFKTKLQGYMGKGFTWITTAEADLWVPASVGFTRNRVIGSSCHTSAKFQEAISQISRDRAANVC